MAAPVFSTRIWDGQVPLTPAYNQLGIVPSKKRIVIRQVNVAQVVSASNAFLLYRIQGTHEVLRVTSTDINPSGSWEGRVVFHEGETIWARCLGAACTIYVGGYIFDAEGGPVFPT
jgi:hypothetical protein